MNEDSRRRLTGAVRPRGCAFAGAMLLILSQAALAAAPTAQEMLSALAAQQKLPPFQMRCTLETTHWLGEEVERRESQTSVCYCDGVRFDLQEVTAAGSRDGPPGLRPARRIINGGKVLTRLEDGPPGERKALMLCISANPMRLRPGCYAEWGPFLAGDLGPTLGNILDAMSLLAAQARIEGTEMIGQSLCYVVSARTTRGQCRLWLDPAVKYAPRKMTLARIAIEGAVTISDIQYRRIGDRDVAVSGTYVSSGKRADGTPFKTQYTIKREEVLFNPDFRTLGAFVMDGVPEGSRVYHLEEPRAHYTWRDGKAVADPSPPPPAGAPRTPPCPTLDSMSQLGAAISQGDKPALAELEEICLVLYRGIDYELDEERVMSNLKLMRAAFDEIGRQAGAGNKEAFNALLVVLNSNTRPLRAFAPDALGIAAAAGHRGAMEALLAYYDHNILLSSAVSAMAKPAAAGDPRAVAFLAEVLTRPRLRALWPLARTGLQAAAHAGSTDARKALAERGAADR